MIRTITLLFTLAALAGCAGPSDPEAVFRSMVVAPREGAAGPLKLGMTADEAVARLGEPESRYPDFLAWRGGKVTAVVREGRVATIRISDPAIPIEGVHVGQDLTAAKKAFPEGEYELDEVPVYELKGVKHAWFEVTPAEEQELLAVVLSREERPAHHD